MLLSRASGYSMTERFSHPKLARVAQLQVPLTCCGLAWARGLVAIRAENPGRSAGGAVALHERAQIVHR
jgi:hypothetical protein